MDDKGNNEELAWLQLMNQRSHDDIKWIISLLIAVGACVASTLEEME
jgi:hypothetical protein